ncbi:hypothetical protein Blut17040_17890 [Blautia luti]|nr:hypothetical protein Blut17040_17890 [Blautia luti]
MDIFGKSFGKTAEKVCNVFVFQQMKIIDKYVAGQIALKGMDEIISNKFC